jgi:CHAD domain-containing protein
MPRSHAAKKPLVVTTTPSRDQILALMREQLEVIRAKEPGTRLGTDSEELHGMRAAVRRLRAILGAVRDMFEPEWLDGLRSELDWLSTVLGGLRDLDVLREYLRKELASLKPAARVVGENLLDLVDAQRVRAQHRILAALDGERYVKLLARLEKAVHRPRWWLRTSRSRPSRRASSRSFARRSRLCARTPTMMTFTPCDSG